ncbi:hypothetical protein CTAYLR_004047 [Chrysophaeum taylorii]|uniref:Deacetylase sirtuin-type domain-containing protein n=1 Tax=Chrysophaeum taylorii TaxID=2483200 RepID=A0AAD7UPC9_9STRA|nr:hypothetical protein CTAYLR_004047 [Chrysophaeum taylorii]
MSVGSGVARVIEGADRVMVLTGAGVSCAAGIPDFRSPGGMYASLRPELLTASESQKQLMREDPVYVVEKKMFLANQFPYHEVRRPFILGTQERRWKPTLFHRFVERLDKRGKLLRVVTQNIDGLEFLTQTDPERIVPCHGTIARAACEACGAEMLFDDYCAAVRANIKDIYGVDPEAPAVSTNIRCGACGKPTVKPTTVLFGASLPDAFFASLRDDLPRADLLIVAGTSLVVSPANLVAAHAPCRRVLVNNEPVGEHLGLDFSRGGDDIFLEGDAEDTFGRLLHHLGWLQDVPPDDLPPHSRKIRDNIILSL